MEEFAPAGHELRLSEEPEYNEEDEQREDSDLVEAHRPEVLVVLPQYVPDPVGLILLRLFHKNFSLYFTDV